MYQNCIDTEQNGKGGNVSGTLYLPSTPQENNALDVLKRK
jgi:hypothetical protein